jgi:hypothetical protein
LELIDEHHLFQLLVVPENLLVFEVCQLLVVGEGLAHGGEDCFLHEFVQAVEGGDGFFLLCANLFLRSDELMQGQS